MKYHFKIVGLVCLLGIVLLLTGCGTKEVIQLEATYRANAADFKRAVSLMQNHPQLKEVAYVSVENGAAGVKKGCEYLNDWFRCDEDVWETRATTTHKKKTNKTAEVLTSAGISENDYQRLIHFISNSHEIYTIGRTADGAIDFDYSINCFYGTYFGIRFTTHTPFVGDETFYLVREIEPNWYVFERSSTEKCKI